MDKLTEKDLDRYIKVRKLAMESPNEGERTAAQRTLQRWDDQWRLKGINIAKEAAIWSGLQDTEPQESSRHWSDVYAEQQTRKQDDWKQKFNQWGQAASSAFSWAADVASHAFAAQEARVLATEDAYTRIQVKTNPTGSMSINIRVSPETIGYLHQLSEEQKIAYVNTLGQRVANDLFDRL